MERVSFEAFDRCWKKINGLSYLHDPRALALDEGRFRWSTFAWHV